MAEARGEDRRKYRRFSDQALAGVEVNMVPVPPLYGEPAKGVLVDLSAGGMAVLLPELIPKKIFLRMKLAITPNLIVESVVTVHRATKQSAGDFFLHGIEFLNPSPDSIQALENLGKDILSCDDRIKQQASEVCLVNCTFFEICTRPQRREENKTPSVVQLQGEPTEPSSAWSDFKSKFRKRLKGK